MASRVNLNVPPRLIESARAAQYANREAQGARELVRKIKDRTQQQREAAKRAQPQAQTADGQGGVFDAPAMNRVPRIWRKRRPIAVGEVGLGFMYERYTLSPPYSRYISIGSANGNQWITFSLPQPLSQKTSLVLPCNEAAIFLVGFMRDSSFASVDARAFYVTRTTVQEVAVPAALVNQYFDIVGSAVFGSDRYRSNYLWPSLYGLGYAQLADNSLKPLQSAANFPDVLAATSGVYAGLLSAASLSLSAQDARNAFGDDIPVLGLKAPTITELLTYRPDRQAISLGAYTGQQYGAISDMQVTDQRLFVQPVPSGPNIFTPQISNPRTELITLDDLYVQAIAPTAALPTAPGDDWNEQVLRQIVAWDYHGDTYCRDKLAQLGFDL